MEQWPPIEGDNTSLAGIFVILALFFVLGMIGYVFFQGKTNVDSGTVDYHQSVENS